ncbi:hypothetical protein GCM10010116_52950 [Microbispora rosea subsp. aerata]|nr:DUF3710 domain-containing protein [Microbispora rosea]GGO26390.1 hypothetical protein GCM10010116_52950 [Microbispora rosea subsp. aerata]GIH54212.1 hypothetical protein Mro02_11260 [Microbispora rosea subsp. aerata]GLJ83597.1 hypothetical protein GCM10017588_23250 [Microbispora rosea subsp. aerata]
MFRRRRRAEEETAPAVVREESPAPARTTGPWDADDDYPEAERVDLGGLRLPVGPGFEIQLRVEGDQITGALVLLEGSLLQVQAVAAPKRGGLWDEVRAELARDVNAAGGSVEEREGPFGPELAGRAPAQGQAEPQPVRFLGVDGPRWMLHGVISGAAAIDPEAARPLEDVVRGIVVVRGDEPMPPREAIQLRLPAEARQAMEEQAARREEFRPFERGPEISEIR